jgi:ERCC4-type nuclease
MAAYGIPCRLSTLAVGDFLWVVRPRAVGASAGTSSSSSSSGAGTAVRGVNAPLSQHNTAASAACEDDAEDTRASNTMDGEPEDEGDETFDPHAAYVLDCVAERKSINDLVSSFGDGRYTEQKNRLKACNLRSTMYIVEGEHIVVSTHQKAISATHVKTAMVSIHVSHLVSAYLRCCHLLTVRHTLLTPCCVTWSRWTAGCTCCGRGASTTLSPACATCTSTFD